ncbi:hypothetical protein RND71_039541 [Anisodus tanguticus]|uniref:DUF1985 domain-containing protein n=1 Tax=Anisodus tanguticus TaxID=243964 RepID=A0AAE1QWS9_9SOLA|nr:hypothetical protein RND71_039541 [Anisodus tanguticus]
MDLVGKSYKEKRFLEDLKSKTVSKKHKELLCLVWFMYIVLWAKDTNINIPLGLVKLAEDPEAFNNYPWGFESYRLTIEYLLRDLKLTMKMVNLYDFLWAFMDWAFEAIPHLRHQVKDYSKEVYFPRFLRWLTAKNNTKLSVDFLNPLRKR